ncbi:MAG: hypothetical protein D6743_16640 [Calditrichaeota bacterium]|nr:MAG: hypothetical protein D6743_16640 [Calditrichota bacterium]
MKSALVHSAAALLLLLLVRVYEVPVAFAQEKGKGDLEDFADDFGDEEKGEEDDSDDAASFFLYAFFDNFSDFVKLWGGTPETEFGPFPSFPYAEGEGFMATADNYRSYFFNTEVSYHYLNGNLRSFLFKWETQFVRKSKLSLDVAFYQETLFDRNFGTFRDRLAFYGLRYGYAVYRSPQLLLNIEAGFRGFQRNTVHGGPEIALDLQLFPRKPLVIETEFAAAYVSNAPLYTFESSLGVLMGRFELLGGVRILKNRSSDLLDGFKLGLRIWY